MEGADERDLARIRRICERFEAEEAISHDQRPLFHVHHRQFAIFNACGRRRAGKL